MQHGHLDDHAVGGFADHAAARPVEHFVGDRYVFSVLQNGWPVSATWARTAQDRFATVLARTP